MYTFIEMTIQKLYLTVSLHSHPVNYISIILTKLQVKKMETTQRDTRQTHVNAQTRVFSIFIKNVTFARYTPKNTILFFTIGVTLHLIFLISCIIKVLGCLHGSEVQAFLDGSGQRRGQLDSLAWHLKHPQYVHGTLHVNAVGVDLL